ncbi:unnamed protein product [Fraxinus pennsylvanica]|uniref:SLC26A/SulP transporter domain-containing protein n=1 Tax=Fraxinus pennsylvanica TaxID=56036 RepID=A0AAD2A6L7_9LAMI|nr:unnamed protein product [Fraxinus pennsylvanica]
MTAPEFLNKPKYDFGLFKYDLLAGITIDTLAIPQGISYANLARLPPIIGLYSSFVPPLIYAVFRSSKNLAVGRVSACSLFIAETIEEKVSPTEDLKLYPSVVYTTTFISGLLQTAMGLLRKGLVGRSFGLSKNEQIDGNKEMIALGLMNIVASFTSCYLTTGPFSKTTVNFKAGCKTAMSNVVMSLCMLLVALSAIFMSAMLGLIEHGNRTRDFSKK